MRESCPESLCIGIPPDFEVMIQQPVKFRIRISFAEGLTRCHVGRLDRMLEATAGPGRAGAPPTSVVAAPPRSPSAPARVGARAPDVRRRWGTPHSPLGYTCGVVPCTC
eukprot:COSAG02_NODE_3112_length_7339_cov_13.532182_1_plen_109_part_00